MTRRLFVLVPVIWLVTLPAVAQLLLMGVGGASTSSGGGTVVLVTSSQCSAIASGANCTITTTGTGHGIFALIETFTASNTFSAVSVGGDTLTQVPSVNVTCAGVSGDIWYAPSTGGARSTFTVTTSGGASWYAVVYETTGANASTPLDQHNTSTGTGANPLGPSITTTANSELIITQELVNGTASAVASPFTFDAALGGDGWGHNVTSSSGTYQPSWTSSGGTSCGNIASFQP